MKRRSIFGRLFYFTLVINNVKWNKIIKAQFNKSNIQVNFEHA